MFIAEKLLYIQLQKTASTHITKLLKELVGGNQQKKHSLPSLSTNADFVLGSIRNPWDWYVSLWSYGCKNKGGLYQRLTHRTNLLYRIRLLKTSPFSNYGHFLKGAVSSFFKPKYKWKEVYTDANNPFLFQSWLKMLLDPKRKYDLCELYAESKLCPNYGFLTYRYMNMFCKKREWLYLGKRNLSLEDIEFYNKKNNIVDYFIHIENLEDDFVKAITKAGYSLEPEVKNKILNKDKSNTSTRQSYIYYYDKQAVKLIEEKEAFIIKTHGYSF